MSIILKNESDVERVKELGNLKIAAFWTDGTSDADILVVGKGGVGDGTEPLRKKYTGSTDYNTLLKINGETATYVVIFYQ